MKTNEQIQINALEELKELIIEKTTQRESIKGSLISFEGEIIEKKVSREWLLKTIDELMRRENE